MWLFCLFGAVPSCTINESISGKNVSYLYKDQSPITAVDFVVLNQLDQSQVFFRLRTDRLGVGRDEDGNEVAGYSVRYRLFRNYSDPIAIDSGRFVRKDVLTYGATYLSDSLNVPTKDGYTYVLECIVNDLNSTLINNQFIEISRIGVLADQDALLFDRLEGLQYSRVVSQTDSFILKPSTSRDKLLVKYYDRSFPPASPPFSTVTPRPFDFTPTSVSSLERLSDRGFLLPVTRQGFYQIVQDSEDKEGASFFYFGQYYPEAKTLIDLLEPLRYITTNDEYQKLLEGGELKKNVDAHWLKLGGNPDRARELIRAFYSRVQYANTFFSSYLPGWKSDRGMCYIVYGPPDIVYRSTSAETWLYGEEGKYNALSLTFTRVVNPFTRNDFRLNRSVSLKNSWYRAVEFWRQGRVLTYQ